MRSIPVKKIQIICGLGCDVIVFEVDLPNGVYPFNGNADMKMNVARDTGEEYVKEHFPNTEYEVIQR